MGKQDEEMEFRFSLLSPELIKSFTHFFCLECLAFGRHRFGRQKYKDEGFGEFDLEAWWPGFTSETAESLVLLP